MKKALFVWGGWNGHEPMQCVALFTPFLLEQGYEVEISDTLDAYLDPEKMQALDLLVQIWTMWPITSSTSCAIHDASCESRHIELASTCSRAAPLPANPKEFVSDEL